MCWCLRRRLCRRLSRCLSRRLCRHLSRCLRENLYLHGPRDGIPVSGGFFWCCEGWLEWWLAVARWGRAVNDRPVLKNDVTLDL